jgi:hypothetical protein
LSKQIVASLLEKSNRLQLQFAYESVLLDDINFRLINSLLKIAVSARATLSEQMNLATPRELRREEDAAGSASS